MDIDIRTGYKKYQIEEGADILKLIGKVLSSLNLEMREISSGGGSDTNIFNENGIRSVNLGIGMENVHTTDERLAVNNLVNTVKIVCGLAGSGGIDK